MKNNTTKILMVLFLITGIILQCPAYKTIPPKNGKAGNDNSTKSVTAGCITPSAATEISLNNVRALIFTGGDMWWDLAGSPRYEIPKGSGKHSLFAGAIWIGGTDINGQLRVTAARYRENGTDYFAGPLKYTGTDRGTTTAEECVRFDKHFVITRNEVAEFRAWWRANRDNNQELLASQFAGYSVPRIIIDWPAINTAPDYDPFLAPFHDENNDLYYNPEDGDYPLYDLDKAQECKTHRRIPTLYGDETLWWVYNDRGNIHTESGGSSIGMEIRAQYFAFSTNDELNNMTFGNYQLINRSTYTLQNCYFGVFTDADLGSPEDDFTGTDVSKGLGYVYNGVEEDGNGSGNTYGKQPPAIGVDFFEGPYQDPDGKDNLSNWVEGELKCDAAPITEGSINGLNFNDQVIDNERWGMRRFVYFNRGSCNNVCDPVNAVQYYNYLRGFWKDGVGMTYSGNGYLSSNVYADFMFPDDTDPCGWGTNGIPQPPWAEWIGDNAEGDRRFIHSAGPFTLEPGATNDITVGMVWARAISGGAWASVGEVRRADEKAQRLFDVCFNIVDGPHSPELQVIELDRQLLFHIYNLKGSNNYYHTPEDYHELDPFIICPDSDQDCDKYFTFQGYQVFQLKDQSCSVSDMENPEKARLVFQCDKKDDVARLVNFEYDNELGMSVPKIKVDGSNNGIQHSFTLTDDAFAAGDKRLVNHKTYYYTAIAYGYNNFKQYSPDDPMSFDGQKKPYLPSRMSATGSVKVYKVIPHITSPANSGTILNSQFGDGPKITQIEGHGNGNNEIELTQKTIDKIMQGPPWIADSVEYNFGKGPVKIKVIDPLNIPAEDFCLKFIPDSTTVSDTASSLNSIINARWMAYKLNATKKSDTVWSDSWINYLNEQLIPQWGISVTINQVPWPCIDNPASFRNGYISSGIQFADPSKRWLSFIPDVDGCGFPNWIRCGTAKDENNPSCNDYNEGGSTFKDKDQFFEKIVDGTWAPYAFCMKDDPNGPDGPVYHGAAFRLPLSISSNVYRLSSVLIVITSDKSKWTRCPVIEMCEYVHTQGLFKPGMSKGVQFKFGLRRDASVDKNGNSNNVLTGDSANPDYSNYIASRGMGWFPGYTIDVETGARLNMAFGEDSRFPGQNGSDMMWNPTNNLATDLYLQTGGRAGDLYYGGKHLIYVWGNNYRSYNTGYMPAYDAGKYLYSKLSTIQNENVGPANLNAKRNLWQKAMWVSIPYLSSDVQMQTNPSNPYYFIQSDVTIKICVANPYQKSIGDFEKPEQAAANNNLPMYYFSLKELKPVINDNETAINALDLIKVVPNPYYGYSAYENSQLDYKVKITNLPQKCTISIFTINGTLIRRYKKDSHLSYQDWDLKNEYGVMIASGLYIVHIDAPNIGEKVIKWFGAIRPMDFSEF